jgi:hypothetical protein
MHFRHALGGRLRQRPNDEAKAGWRELTQLVTHGLLELSELEGPGARARVDDQRPVSSDTCRPGVPCDRLAYRSGPRGHDVSHAGGARGSTAETPKLPFDGRAEGPGQRAPARPAHLTTTSPGETSRTRDGSTPSGSARRLVAVTSV